MKSFVPTFNLSVFNLSLKSGIWFGVTAVSLASGAVTVVNHWDPIKREVEGFYERTIKTYILDSAFKATEFMKKNMIAGYPVLYWKIKGWYDVISPAEMWKWMGKNLTLENLKNSYSFLFKKSSGYIDASLEKLINFFGPSGLLNEKNIKALIIALVASAEFIVKVLKNLKEFQKIFEILKKEYSQGRLYSLFSEYASIFSSHPGIVPHLNRNDIERALEQSTGVYYEGFLKRSKDLKENPIDKTKIKNDMALKNEVLNRLLEECDSTENLIFGSLCEIGKNVKNMLKSSTSCPKGGCNNENIFVETTESLAKGATNAVSKLFKDNRKTIKGGLKRIIGGFASVLRYITKKSSNGVEGTPKS